MAVSPPVQQPDPFMTALKNALFISTPQTHAPLDMNTSVQAGQKTPSMATIYASLGAPLNLSSIIVAMPGRVGSGYIAVPPVTQWTGVNRYGSYDKNGVYTTGYQNWKNGTLSYFKLDSRSVPVEIWDDQLNTWRPYLEFLGDPYPITPIIIDKVLNDQKRSELALNMASSGFFKAKSSEYITIGDEVSPGSLGTIDLKGMLNKDDYDLLTQYLTFMPRQFLRNFFMLKIYPGIPWAQAPFSTTSMAEGTMIKDQIYGGYYGYKAYMPMVWAGFVDLFNVANLNYVNQNQLSPWDWEQKKLTAYYQSQDSGHIADLQKQFTEFDNVTLALDPLAKKIMDDFASLPKLGDVGMEINRQNAVKELLKMKEYESAQAIVDAFRYAKDTVLGPELTKPIENNVVLSNGTVLAEKTRATTI